MLPESAAPFSDLHEQLRFMQESLDHLTDLVIVTDASPRPVIIYVNQAVITRTGYNRDELLGRTPGLLQGEGTDREAVARMNAAIEARVEAREELLNYTRAGDPYWIELHIRPLRGKSGDVTHFVSTQVDITERKRTEQDLLLFRHAIDQSPSSVIITNREGRITYVNRGFEANTGYDAKEVYGRRPGFRAWSRKSEEEKRAFWQCLNSGHAWKGEFINRRKNGDKVIKRAIVSPVRQENGEIIRFLSVEQDVTAEKEALAQLEFLAYHDALTGLPGRRLFEQHVEEALVRTPEGTSLAFVLVTIDNLRRVNDTHGYGVGDEVLKSVARRVQSYCHGEGEMASCLSGNEFCLLLKAEGCGSQGWLPARIQALQRLMNGPVVVFGQTLSISSSVGVACLPQHGRDFATARCHADLALKRAKQQGAGCYAVFEPELGRAALRRVRLEEALRHALQQDALSIAVQSQYSPDGQVRGAEVLVRWQLGPEGRPVSPAEFVPIAEASGLIRSLTLQVLAKALDLAAGLMRQGIEIPLSVNFSTGLLQDDALVEAVLALLHDKGVPARMLILEITESLFIDAHQGVPVNMGRLSAAGLRFSLDDFGTGYSNLAYLKRLPLYELKIDKSFVDDVLEDEDRRAIVRAILAIARKLKLCVVAEGVETHAQANYLIRHGCDLLQGYVLHKPQPAEAWLQQLMKEM
ncbi:putative bifunctional diguanylate cyclase/phosphodiesterase [Marinobacterium marinum]|uniref:EAL domain-containing protein n=1 Tax=Marinobacterium marinum TaxID=2756129 RepID=A0A7W1WWJ1_9GAMM|nr:EAL domain-containing protein [Marinobacterium marinum]MBA4501497.1 EAL domain-containing protein [Marinobacterium marinum]